MNQIKTDLRTRLETHRLDDLMLLAIEGPEPDAVDWSAVIAIWYKMKDRRVNLDLALSSVLAAPVVGPGVSGSGSGSGRSSGR